MAFNTLHDLLIHEVKDLYDAEHRILDTLTALIDIAAGDALRQSLEEHKAQTEEHIARLERVFELLEMEPAREDCKGITGILEEGRKALDKAQNDNARDAAIVTGCMRVEHYEIAGYGTAATFAAMMQHEEIAELLEETFDEEEETEQRLLEIAETELDPSM